jgi:hypothetical protein
MNHRQIPILCAALLLLSAGAAAAQPQRSDTVVKLATAPRQRGVATLVSEMKIGGADATADEYLFARVGELLPLRNGSIVVVDQGTGTTPYVRVYDGAGKYLRTLGRQGQGPGEYTFPSGLGELPDGRILVRDGRGSRIAVYGNGSTGAQFFSANVNGTSTGQNMLIVSDAGIVHLRMTFPRLGTGVPSQSGYIRLRADGSVIDTIPAPEFPPPAVRFTATRTSADGGTSSSSIGLPFSPLHISGFSTGGYFVTANTGRYAIDLRVPPAQSRMWREGDPVISIRRTAPPIAVNDAERADRRKRIEEQLRQLEPNWQWNGPEIPRVKPPVKSLRFGLDGRIWVLLSQPSERFDPATDPSAATTSMGGGGGGRAAGAGAPAAPVSSRLPWREPVLYDVYEPDGAYIGQVGVPYNISISATRGDYAWGVESDEDGVQSVHRFRITWMRR